MLKGRNGTLLAITASFLLSCLLYKVSFNDVSLVQFGITTAILSASSYSYFKWHSQPRHTLPLFAILSFMYWLYFGLAVYLGERTVGGQIGIVAPEVSNGSVTNALLLAGLGVFSLWIGMQIRLGKRIVVPYKPTITLVGRRLQYVRAVLIFGGILGSIEVPPFVFGEGSRQMLTIAISIIPTLAFTLLFIRCLRREGAALDKLLVVGFLIFRLITGLSSGWLGAFPSTLVVCAAIYIAETRKVPWTAVTLVVIFTLFFQVGKKDFRTAYWTEQADATKIDRVTFWTQRSFEIWTEAITDPSGEVLKEGLNQSLARLSLLTQSANVVDQTPSIVPYQYGRLYSYMAITWIPRLLWPGKPSMNEANRFYQVTYGLSTEENVDSVNIGVGVLTEGYISFGWIGAAGIMFLIGIFCDFYQVAFLQRSSGMLMNGIGIVLLPQMMGVESQVAVYLGGFVQQVSFTLVLLLPVIEGTQNKASLLPVSAR